MVSTGKPGVGDPTDSDESALNSYGFQNVPEFLDSERFRAYWLANNWREGFDPEFVEFLEARIGL